jgi:TPR repeat protein
LATVFLNGNDIPKSVERAVPLLIQSAASGNEHAQYRLSKLYLAGEDVPKDVNHAIRYLTDAAERGNQYAQYALGKLYLMGDDMPCDRETAMRWFTMSAAQGNQYAQLFLDNSDRWDNPSTFLMASRLLHHLGRIFRNNTPQPHHGGIGLALDRKLLRKLQEKKVSQGHSRDEHGQYELIM